MLESVLSLNAYEHLACFRTMQAQQDGVCLLLVKLVHKIVPHCLYAATQNHGLAENGIVGGRKAMSILGDESTSVAITSRSDSNLQA